MEAGGPRDAAYVSSGGSIAVAPSASPRDSSNSESEVCEGASKSNSNAHASPRQATPAFKDSVARASVGRYAIGNTKYEYK